MKLEQESADSRHPSLSRDPASAAEEEIALDQEWNARERRPLIHRRKPLVPDDIPAERIPTSGEDGAGPSEGGEERSIPGNTSNMNACSSS